MVKAFADTVAQRSTPWIELTRHFDRHRLGEMNADLEESPYSTADPAWAMTTALLAGAGADPVLARVSSRIAGMLATPPEALSDPQVRARVGPFLASPRYPAEAPHRADLLAAVAGSRVLNPATHG